MNYNYDKKSYTKTQVEEWADEMKGVVVEDDLFYRIVFPHRKTDKD
jgi:hypothetical protein